MNKKDKIKMQKQIQLLTSQQLKRQQLEELKRLYAQHQQEELKYLRAENTYLKKLDILIRQIMCET